MMASFLKRIGLDPVVYQSCAGDGGWSRLESRVPGPVPSLFLQSLLVRQSNRSRHGSTWGGPCGRAEFPKATFVGGNALVCLRGVTALSGIAGSNFSTWALLPPCIVMLKSFLARNELVDSLGA